MVPALVIARGRVKGTLASERRGVQSAWVLMRWSIFVAGFPWKEFLCLTPFVINIVVATICFLISLLFLVAIPSNVLYQRRVGCA